MSLSPVDVWGIDQINVEQIDEDGNSRPLYVEHRFLRDDEDDQFHTVVAEVGFNPKWRYIAVVAQDYTAKKEHTYYHLGHFRDLKQAERHIRRFRRDPQNSVVATLPLMCMDDGRYLSLYQTAYMSAFDHESFTGIFEAEHGCYCLVAIPDTPGITGIIYEPNSGIPRYLGSFDNDLVSPAVNAHNKVLVYQSNITLAQESRVAKRFEAYEHYEH
ncbi:hypothetical protein MIB92_05695 [Aestuariirhabdus sp. Z084]|uniref:hypothetical protein n=1 Tax=Aestuariirhabdus haliotis TaxID=2918751 RepID=UPI00201B37F5|nr:hypothetical protein [Aestuariirhabdus haliotis]MCL6415136.1 hypothetical protein [Aestuariirhabdus haliotis]MCL6419068.1 hypothetical protein [Aestuariirhabdus haliotis]